MPHSPFHYRLAAFTMMLAVLIAHHAAAEEPPFSLGGPERVAEIRKTFAADMLPYPLATPNTEFDKTEFEFYIEKAHPGVVLMRTILLYKSEIVSEEIFFKAPAPESLTDQETVRSAVPWAAKWAESTLKRASKVDADHDFVLTEVPLYTASRKGWVAKLYRVKNSARLIVEKLGIPGVNIEDSVTNATQKALIRRLESEKAEKEKAGKAKQ